MTFALPLMACTLNSGAGFYMASLALSAAFGGRLPSAAVLGAAALCALAAALWMATEAKDALTDGRVA